MSDSIFHWKQQAKGTEAEDLITKKMFPKREEYQWRPAPVLCKRFDLIDPYMGKVVYSVFLPTVLFPVLPYSKLFFLLTNPCPFLFFFLWNTCFSKNLPFSLKGHYCHCHKFCFSEYYINSMYFFHLQPAPAPRMRSKIDTLIFTSDSAKETKVEETIIANRDFSMLQSDVQGISQDVAIKENEVEVEVENVERPVDLYKVLLILSYCTCYLIIKVFWATHLKNMACLLLDVI